MLIVLPGEPLEALVAISETVEISTELSVARFLAQKAEVACDSPASKYECQNNGDHGKTEGLYTQVDSLATPVKRMRKLDD